MLYLCSLQRKRDNWDPIIARKNKIATQHVQSVLFTSESKMSTEFAKGSAELALALFRT